MYRRNWQFGVSFCSLVVFRIREEHLKQKFRYVANLLQTLSTSSSNRYSRFIHVKVFICIDICNRINYNGDNEPQMICHGFINEKTRESSTDREWSR